MIAGIVNGDFEAMLSLSICRSDGKVYTQDAIIEDQAVETASTQTKPACAG
jgi:hypothetical protein